jgi:hypothetical protein
MARLVYLSHNNFKRDGISYSEVYKYNGDSIENYTCKNFLGYAPTAWCVSKGVEALYKNHGNNKLHTAPICSRQAVLDNVGCDIQQLETYLSDKRLSHVTRFNQGCNVCFRNLGGNEIGILKKLHREHTSKR